MPTIIVSKKNKKTGRFVTIPRKEYEELLSLKKIIPISQATKAELRAIKQGRKEIKEGKYTSWEDVRHEMANLHN